MHISITLGRNIATKLGRAGVGQEISAEAAAVVLCNEKNKCHEKWVMQMAVCRIEGLPGKCFECPNCQKW